jgi:phosphoadenosine phosphosulfate reductase
VLLDKEQKAIDVIRLASELSETYYYKPLVVCFSGGKDSIVLLHLALRAGVEIEVINSHVTIDPPELVYFTRGCIKDLQSVGIKAEIRKPKYKGKSTNMWQLIVDKGMPPTRLTRYCCSILKESSTPKRISVVGVRAAESKKRQGRDSFADAKNKRYMSLEHIREQFESSLQSAKELGQNADEADSFDCVFIQSAKKNESLLANPIYEFTDEEIWDYIHYYNVPYCSLYDKGYSRLGCVGCPLVNKKQRLKEMNDFPKYRENYIKAFDRMLQKRFAQGKTNGTWKTGMDVYNWWMGIEQPIDGQMKISDIDMNTQEE